MIYVKNGELLPDSPEDRKAIFDLYCIDEKGSEFIVELQKVHLMCQPKNIHKNNSLGNSLI
jgi:hypothetical protein